MSSDAMGWESLLHSDAPSACPIKAALFTTYDRADERILVEHLLPLFLKLCRDPDDQGAERQYFLLELDHRLKQLHDKLVVVSSVAREEPPDKDDGESGMYGWIWRSIRHFTVGRRRPAVQHAKLWLLHWGAAEEQGVEYLEIVVSSANLTRAAFKGQIQAVWRACIELRPERSESRLKRWGVLPAFLRELAASVGHDERFASFAELLARAECPEGITFVASVPGRHSRQTLRRTPWGLAGLKEIAPSGQGTASVSILSPYIGSWKAETLAHWCDEFGGTPKRLKLVWIDEDHPWARDGRWLLPEATSKTFAELGASLLKHDPTDSFHEEHRVTATATDPRWSHAKVYSFHRGHSRRLLSTSGNFTLAAWGRWIHDELEIDNFELGVCVEQANWPLFDQLESFDHDDAATVPELPSQVSVAIMWASAAWDGKNVDVQCWCKASEELVGKLNCRDEGTAIVSWTLDGDDLRSACIPWTDGERPPVSVRVTCGQETVNVPVFDDRPSSERETFVPPEVNKDAAQAMRDELLFEQYGGRVAGETADEQLGDFGEAVPELEDDVENDVRRAESYSIPAFEIARRHLAVVDNWSGRVMQAMQRTADDFERRLLRRDGELLIEAFKRQKGRDDKKAGAEAIGAKLAADELGIRLKHFPEA